MIQAVFYQTISSNIGLSFSTLLKLSCKHLIALSVKSAVSSSPVSKKFWLNFCIAVSENKLGFSHLANQTGVLLHVKHQLILY